MEKRIFYLFLSLLITFILVGFLLHSYKSQENVFNVTMTDIVEDPLVNFSEAREIFNINCAACHKIGGISDPDLLRNLDSKMKKEYFFLFIRKQDSLIENKDEYATKIGSFIDFSHVAISHTFDFLNEKDTDKIYEYIVAVKSR